MRTRLVRVSELLARVPLVVRGLTQASGKRVRVELDAGSAELDKAVAERLFPAVMHLVRNAVDHALEAPEARARAGKPEEGRLAVSCCAHAGRDCTVSVEDDGAGVDAEEVARRAGQPVPSTARELLDLLCRAGLSTAAQVTHTSGRGMGMDVVRRTVTELGGELALETRRGVGSRFTLRVPVSVTIVDAFSFTCGEETFVVPVAAVDDLVELDPADVSAAPASVGARGRFGEVRLLRRPDGALPLLRLDHVLDLPPSQADRPKAIVVHRDDERLAFQVDRMLGKQEVVVRPVVDPLVHVAGVAGTADLGDGRPRIVLDLAALWAAGAAAPRTRAAAEAG